MVNCRWFFVIAAQLFLIVSAHAATLIQGCQIYPADNAWNRDVSADPVDPNSDNYIAHILQGGNQNVHPDFGSNPAYGIPYVVVPGTQPKVPIQIVAYPDESDPGPYPVPLDAPVESGSDGHVLCLDKDNAKLYEMYQGKQVGAGWTCSSGAVFDLTSDALRPDGFTSADAAGLPILPGLARYDEVTAGTITHALRFTVHQVQKAYIHPATHLVGSSTDPNDPPMGLRLRLKASFDISKFTGESLVILTGLKKYGMFVADIGTDWYISGDTNPNWDDNDLNQLKTVPGTAFEVVQSGPILNSSGSSGSSGTGGSGGTGGTSGGATPPTVTSLVIQKMSVKLNFTQSSNDSISLSGAMPVPDGFSVAGKQVVATVGGVSKTFTLDSHSSVHGTTSFSIRVKSIKKVVSAQNAPFTLRLTKDNFQSALAPLGLTANVTASTTVTIPVSILIGQTNWQAMQIHTYSVKGGKVGQTK